MRSNVVVIVPVVLMLLSVMCSGGYNSLDLTWKNPEYALTSPDQIDDPECRSLMVTYKPDIIRYIRYLEKEKSQYQADGRIVGNGDLFDINYNVLTPKGTTVVKYQGKPYVQISVSKMTVYTPLTETPKSAPNRVKYDFTDGILTFVKCYPKNLVDSELAGIIFIAQHELKDAGESSEPNRTETVQYIITNSLIAQYHDQLLADDDVLEKSTVLLNDAIVNF